MHKIQTSKYTQDIEDTVNESRRHACMFSSRGQVQNGHIVPVQYRHWLHVTLHLYNIKGTWSLTSVRTKQEEDVHTIVLHV